VPRHGLRDVPGGHAPVPLPGRRGRRSGLGRVRGVPRRTDQQAARAALPRRHHGCPGRPRCRGVRRRSSARRPPHGGLRRPDGLRHCRRARRGAQGAPKRGRRRCRRRCRCRRRRRRPRCRRRRCRR
ncbi:unnamed protein product, partial [Prorocentrum cordatum]